MRKVEAMRKPSPSAVTNKIVITTKLTKLTSIKRQYRLQHSSKQTYKWTRKAKKVNRNRKIRVRKIKMLK
jgi:predicted SAM-dependent methyltransferase